MTNHFFFAATILLLLLHCSFRTFAFVGWRALPPPHTSTSTSTTFAPSLRLSAANVEGVSVSDLPLSNLEADAAFLEKSIRESLDDEWIPQACHAEIGKEVGRIYVAARRGGGDDLNSLLVDWGTGLTGFGGMDDAFVGAWDVANQAADLVLLRLNRERCGCSIAPILPHFNGEAVGVVAPALEKHFTKYQWLRAVLGGEVEWDVVSTVAGLVMGFRIGPPVAGADVKSSRDESVVVAASSLRARAFPFEDEDEDEDEEQQQPRGEDDDFYLTGAFGGIPPRLDAGAPAVSRLEMALPEEDSDEREALLEMVKAIHGEELVRIAEGEGDREFAARSSVVQWLLSCDFLNREDFL